MANKNFEIKNGLTIAGTERISSSGAFTGSLASATTATTQSSSDNSTKIATTAYTDAAITAVIGGAPGTLDTLNELAAAINDDASYATTLTTALATKLPLAGGTLTGPLTVSPSTGTAKISFTSQGAGSEVFSVNGQIPGVNNTGFAIRNETDSRNDFILDGSGNATFSGDVTTSYGFQAGYFKIGSTVIVNANRDLTNIGTISSGAITTTGITSTGTLTVPGGTSGSRTIKDSYTSGALANQGTIRSSGGNYWGYGTYQDGSANWKSAVSVALERSVFAIDEDTAYWSHAPSQTVAIGSDLTTQPTKKIVFDLENGRIGIGTDNPTQKLEVAGDIRISDARSLFFKRHGDNYAWRVRNESASDGSTYGFGGINKLVFEVVSNSSLNAAPSDTSHNIYASSTNALVLTEQGRVGIGTDSPGERLEVDGVIQIKRTSDHPAMRFSEVVSGAATTRAYFGSGDWAINGGDVDDFGISGSGTGDLLLGTNAGVERLRITNNGSVAVGGPATAGKSFEVQGKQSGYSGFWYDDENQAHGRGVSMTHGLLGVNSTQYDGDGAYWPVAGFAAAADNSTAESVDFWFGTTTSEWLPMTFFAVGAHTASGQTGQTAGWALIRATHYNNGISVSILDSGGGGTFSCSVIGTLGADRANTSRARITYSSNQNRSVISVWGVNYSGFYGATRS